MEGPEPEETLLLGGQSRAVHETSMLLREEGAGPEVLFLHGTLLASEGFLPFFPYLEGFRRIALDLPGFGGTPAPEGFDFSLSAYGRFLAAALEELGVRDATLVLSDLAVPVAGVALALQGDPRGRVGRLVLLNGPLYEDLQKRSLWGGSRGSPLLSLLVEGPTNRMTYRRRLLKLFADPRLLDEGLVDRAWTSYQRRSQATQHRLAEQGEEFHRTLPEGRRALADLEKPLLVLWGEDDPTQRLEQPRRFEVDFPRARVVLLPEVGHFPHLEAPEVVAEEIRAFASTR
jgi:pimeloyl-ACP methyl ester carboxylesterase